MKRSDIDLLPEPSRTLFRKALEKADREARKAAADAAEKLPDVPVFPAGAIKMERDLQRLCEMELSRRGIVYMHLSPRAREKAGWPDLTFANNGRPYAIELKGPVGVLADHQSRLLMAMAANGWQTAVVRSYEQFRAILDEPWEGQA